MKSQKTQSLPILKTVVAGLLLATPLASFGATEILTANDPSLEDTNSGRVMISATLDSTANAQDWVNRANAGLTGDGRIWHGYSRFMMDKRDLFSKINQAQSITYTTGIVQKEKERTVDPEIGGHDVDVYLVLDPDGTFYPIGSLPDVSNAWDWANDLGLGYEHTVYLGRVPQSHPMQTNDPLLEQLAVDDPAMNLTWDITDALKSWIDQGLLTASSTIAFGFVQRAAEIVDEAGNPRFDDPNLFIHSQMVFEAGNAFLTLSDEPSGETWMGFDVDAEGYADTGDWLGFVYAGDAPYIYVYKLSKYAYIGDDSGWMYLYR